MKNQPKQNQLSRRQFMGGAAIASAAFMIVPGRVLGLDGSKPPSDKLNIAGIGIGGQGGHDLDQMTSENIVALCDVDWTHAAHTFKKFPDAKQYKDYRKMLDDQKDIDAVVVGTPDHHHAFASMAAMQQGKHVYCEKPLTHSVWEARFLARAAREHKLATQMGNQGQASDQTRRLCEMIWTGSIGPVREAHPLRSRAAVRLAPKVEQGKRHRILEREGARGAADHDPDRIFVLPQLERRRGTHQAVVP